MNMKILKFKMPNTSHLYNSKENMFMKDNGKIIKETEEENNNGKMVLYMKDIGRII